jgi:hypothetical protein
MWEVARLPYGIDEYSGCIHGTQVCRAVVADRSHTVEPAYKDIFLTSDLIN